MIPDTPSSIVNPGSDDEDSDGRSQSQLSYKERRREAHTQVSIYRTYYLNIIPLINILSFAFYSSFRLNKNEGMPSKKGTNICKN